MPRKKKRKSTSGTRSQPDHIRVYPQFIAMEAWLDDPELPTHDHCGTVIQKELLEREKLPDKNSVDLVREIFQGEKKDEIVIVHNSKAWKITVVRRAHETNKIW